MGALIIVVALSYLQISFRTIQGLWCVRVGDGGLRMASDLRFECYVGTHGRVMPVLVFVLVAVVVAFPICAVLIGFYVRSSLIRFPHIPLSTYTEQYGFIVRGLKRKYLWFRSTQVVTTLFFATETAVAPTRSIGFFAASCNFAVSTCLVGVCNPFVSRTPTFLTVLSGTFSGAQLLFFLFSENRVLFGIGVSVQAVVLLIIALVAWFRVFRSSSSVAPSSSQPQTTSDWNHSTSL